MKHLILALTLLIPSSTCLVAQTRHVTLTFNTYPPRPYPQTNSFTIGPNESAELKAWPPYLGQTTPSGNLVIEKDNTIYNFSGGSSLFDGYSGTKQTQQLIVSGPAVISYWSQYGNEKGLVTFKITPDAFPPDKTFIIPDGTPGAMVTLECSTNLLTWTTATNGFYTGTNGAKFFRINAQRAQ